MHFACRSSPAGGGDARRLLALLLAGSAFSEFQHCTGPLGCRPGSLACSAVHVRTPASSKPRTCRGRASASPPASLQCPKQARTVDELAPACGCLCVPAAVAVRARVPSESASNQRGQCLTSALPAPPASRLRLQRRRASVGARRRRSCVWTTLPSLVDTVEHRFRVVEAARLLCEEARCNPARV